MNEWTNGRMNGRTNRQGQVGRQVGLLRNMDDCAGALSATCKVAVPVLGMAGFNNVGY